MSSFNIKLKSNLLKKTDKALNYNKCILFLENCKISNNIINKFNYINNIFRIFLQLFI